MVRLPHAGGLRSAWAGRLVQRRLPLELRVELRCEQSADRVLVAVEGHVEVPAETAEHWRDLSDRVAGRIVGDETVGGYRHVLVSRHRDGCCVDPWQVRNMVERLRALAQNEHVSHGLRAGLASERGGGQAHHADEFGLARQIGPGRFDALVHRVAAGEQHCHASRTQRVHRAFDKIVVQRQARRSTVRKTVVHGDVARIRHVAYRRVVRVRGDQAFAQVGVDDVRGRVERGGDARADRIDLHARHSGPVRARGDEVAGAAARFQHMRVLVLADAEPFQHVPHGRDDRAWRVEGGERARPGLRVFVRVEQPFDLAGDVGPFRLVAERVRASAPTAVSSQRVKLGLVRLPVRFVFDAVEGLKRFDVRQGAFARGTRALAIQQV